MGGTIIASVKCGRSSAVWENWGKLKTSWAAASWMMQKSNDASKQTQDNNSWDRSLLKKPIL